MLMNYNSMEDTLNQHKLYCLRTVTEKIILFLGMISTYADHICA